MFMPEEAAFGYTFCEKCGLTKSSPLMARLGSALCVGFTHGCAGRMPVPRLREARRPRYDLAGSRLPASQIIV